MNELIATLFLSRDVTHRAHLSTDSYAEHRALGSFYEEVIELADSLAEAYQGYTGKRLGEIPYYSNPSKKDTVETLKLLLKQIQEERKDIEPDYSPIQNVIDEVESLFNSTIYKLTFLK